MTRDITPIHATWRPKPTAVVRRAGERTRVLRWPLAPASRASAERWGGKVWWGERGEGESRDGAA